MGKTSCKYPWHKSSHVLSNILQDRFSSNQRAQELLARIKEDKLAEKQRLAPYYFGGFSHGANTSDTDGVHREELEPYLSGKAKVNGAIGSNGTKAYSLL